MSDIKVFVLKPIHCGNKSFYGKAKVIECDGVKYLKSYSTIVCAITPDNKFVRLWGGYSATTQKHIDSFVRLFDLNYCGMRKKDWESYTTDNNFKIPYEVKNVEMKYKVSMYY